jgi:hypothetical protein
MGNAPPTDSLGSYNYTGPDRPSETCPDCGNGPDGCTCGDATADEPANEAERFKLCTWCGGGFKALGPLCGACKR